MRHASAFVFVIVLTAGCSLVWSMDAYEGGSRGNGRNDSGEGARDGAGSSSGVNGSSGASSGTTSSGTVSSGSSGGDSGSDAGADAETCIAEPEPNTNTATAPEVPVGLTCGFILNTSDLDCYKLTSAGPVTITVELSTGIQVVINPEGAGGSDTISTPGVHNLNFPGSGAGEHSLIFETYTGTGAYKIRR